MRNENQTRRRGERAKESVRVTSPSPNGTTSRPRYQAHVDQQPTKKKNAAALVLDCEEVRAVAPWERVRLRGDSILEAFGFVLDLLDVNGVALTPTSSARGLSHRLSLSLSFSFSLFRSRCRPCQRHERFRLHHENRFVPILSCG